MVQSQHASKFPLNRVFSDYNLTYIQQKDETEMAAAAANGSLFGLKSHHKHNQSMGQLNHLNNMLLNQNYMNIKGDKKFAVNRGSLI